MTAWARIVYGLALLAAPTPLLRLASGKTATTRERAVTRVLGARLLTQAAVTDIRPDAVSVALGAEVDFVHAATMLLWAAVDRGSRRLTLLSAATAGLFAVAGAAQARRTPAVADGPTGDALATLVRLRHRIAEAVARYTMPGDVRAALKT
ncbi:MULTISPECIES: hypothetical protein [unclassified Mycobacterium]|uniref:hypothetical protein n=1 Tax=unclassified Mycobacterium TaxID=2642494 RepID=UPI0007FEF3A9|nr:MULTISPECIES: hypothetical protein [unclassified Mycobacterium]OBH04154.1 hypothetical protein A5696_05700 [Mycobacterium sp. E2699]OBI51537.1 hypothetical protein A5705_08630 [Mycobacterium sp. E787]